MMTGRYFIFRKVTAIKWETEKDGSRTGTIRVQQFKDPDHRDLISESFYKGTIPATEDDSPEAAYRDALAIISRSENRIDPPEKTIDTSRNRRDTIE